MQYSVVFFYPCNNGTNLEGAHNNIDKNDEINVNLSSGHKWNY